MIEPAESESREELDRFCDAMLQIREEIAAVDRVEYPLDDNILCGAPHTEDELVDDNWGRAYSRQQATYPLVSLKEGKYWSPVGRIDNVYGDRNLVCACLPLSEYQ